MGSDLKKTLLWGGFSFCVVVLLLVPGWLRSLSAPGVGEGGLSAAAFSDEKPAPLPKPETLGIVLPPESFAPAADPVPAAKQPEPAHVIPPPRSEEDRAADEEIKRLEKMGVLSY